MATFKVGQRVKRIGGNPDAEYRIGMPAGAEGVIVCLREPHPHIRHTIWLVKFSGGHEWGCIESTLAPLTPPEEVSDTWAADKVRELVKPKPMDVEREVKTPAKAPLTGRG